MGERGFSCRHCNALLIVARADAGDDGSEQDLQPRSSADESSSALHVARIRRHPECEVLERRNVGLLREIKNLRRRLKSSDAERNESEEEFSAEPQDR